MSWFKCYDERVDPQPKYTTLRERAGCYFVGGVIGVAIGAMVAAYAWKQAHEDLLAEQEMELLNSVPLPCQVCIDTDLAQGDLELTLDTELPETSDLACE